MEKKKLYRTVGKDAKLFGVCGGVAEYFEIDPTIVRVATVVLTIFVGAGLLAYLVAALVMPKKSAE